VVDEYQPKQDYEREAKAREVSEIEYKDTYFDLLERQREKLNPPRYKQKRIRRSFHSDAL